MNRIDITGSTYYEIIDELSIRPSVKEKIRHYLYKYDITGIREICKKSEDELLNIPYFSEDLVSCIKAHLVRVGLHFDMTDEQLTDYMDADFFEALSKTEEGETTNATDEDDGYIRVKEEEWEEVKSKMNKYKEKAERSRLFIPTHVIVMLILVAFPAYVLFHFVRQTFFDTSTTKETVKEVRQPETSFRPVDDENCIRFDSVRRKELLPYDDWESEGKIN